MLLFIFIFYFAEWLVISCFAWFSRYFGFIHLSGRLYFLTTRCIWSQVNKIHNSCKVSLSPWCYVTKVNKQTNIWLNRAAGSHASTLICVSSMKLWNVLKDAVDVVTWILPPPLVRLLHVGNSVKIEAAEAETLACSGPDAHCTTVSLSLSKRWCFTAVSTAGAGCNSDDCSFLCTKKKKHLVHCPSNPRSLFGI